MENIYDPMGIEAINRALDLTLISMIYGCEFFNLSVIIGSFTQSYQQAHKTGVSNNSR